MNHSLFYDNTVIKLKIFTYPGNYNGTLFAHFRDATVGF